MSSLARFLGGFALTLFTSSAHARRVRHHSGVLPFCFRGLVGFTSCYRYHKQDYIAFLIYNIIFYTFSRGFPPVCPNLYPFTTLTYIYDEYIFVRLLIIFTCNYICINIPIYPYYYVLSFYYIILHA